MEEEEEVNYDYTDGKEGKVWASYSVNQYGEFLSLNP